MSDQKITDRDLKAAFAERAAGAPSIDIYDRISAEAARTKQSRPLIALPGFASQTTTRLAWAAALAALTIALVGVLAIGAGSRPFTGLVPSESPRPSGDPSPSADPSVQPSPSVEPTPSVAPSPDPTEPATPSASPSGDPTSSPFVPPELGPDRLGRVVATDGLRVRSLPTIGEASTRFDPTLAEGMPFYVVDGPVMADGYAWYLIDPYGEDPALQPFGWVAAGSREGEPWIEVSDLGCDAVPASIEQVGGAEPQETLFCYGVQMPGEHELTGDLVCDFGDIGGGITGADWIELDRFCVLTAPGFTVEDGASINVWGEAVWSLLDAGSPVDGRYTVVGHWDDAGAAECVDMDAPDDELATAEAVLFCRMQFVVTEVRGA